MGDGRPTRYVAYAICALATAACGDALVEAFQDAGVFGRVAIDANHQGLFPVFVLAALALATLGWAIARERFRRAHETDWLLALARDFGRATPRAHLTAIVGFALVFVFAMEEYERGFGGGSPFADARGNPTLALASVGIYIACATIAAAALGAFMRGLVATCDAVVRCVVAIVAWLVRSRACGPAFLSRARQSLARRASRYLCALFGDRAPPQTA